MANVVLNIQVKQNASGELEVVSKGLDKVAAAAGKAKTELGAIGAVKLGAGLGAGIALAEKGINALIDTARGLKNLALDAAKFAEEISNASARTGIAVGALQELKITAENAGLGFDAVLTSVQKMQLALEKSPKVFEQLGLDPKNLKAQEADAALRTVVLAIDEIGSASQRTLAYTTLLGKSGVAAGAVLAQAFKDGAKTGKELNAVLSKDVIAGLGKFDAAVDNLDTAWTGLWRQIGGAIGNSPALVSAIQDIATAVADMAGAVAANGFKFAQAFAQMSIAVNTLKLDYFEFAKTLEGFTLDSIIGSGFAKGLGGFDIFAGMREDAKKSSGAAVAEIDKTINGIKKKLEQARVQLNQAGKVPGLNKLTDRPSGGRGGLDPDAAAAQSAAKKAQEAWQKAAEKAREEWDKFDADMAKRGKDIINELMKSAGGGETTKQMGTRLFQQELDKMEAAAKDTAKQIQQTIASIEFEISMDEEWEAAMKDVRMSAIEMEADTVNAFFNMADAGQQFADDIGGAAGEFVSLASAGVGAYAQIADAINQAKARQEEFGKSVGTTADKINALAGGIRTAIGILSGPGGLKGALGGALAGAGTGAGIGAMFGGPAGAGIGAGIGGVVGFIGGLFGKGKGKQEAEEVKKLQAQLIGLGGSMTDLRKLADKFGISLGNAFNTKKPKDVQKVIDQLTTAMEKQQKVFAGLAQASDSLTGIFTKLKPTTEKGAAAQATIFSTVFWATVKERGFSEAIDALSAPFEALSKSLTEKFGPEVTNRLLGAVSVFFDPKIKESISVFSDIQRALEGVSEAGFITKDSFAAFGQTATDAFAQATAGGLNSQSALQAISPLLGSIINTANQYGLTIDANTQALIDQAKAAGIAFPTSPIEKAAAAMERVASALEKALGISNDLGDSLSNLPNSIPNFKGGGPGGRDDGFPRDFPAAKGFGPKVVGDEGGGLGPRFQTHAGELVMIVPRDQVKKGKKLIYAARGFGQDEDFIDRFDRDRPRPGDRPGGPGGSGTSGASGGTGTAGRPRPGGNVGASIPTVFIEQQRKNDKKFERVLALLEKEAAKPKQTNQIAVTQNVNAAFDPASVPATRQALTQQVLRDISAGVKSGAGELSRAIDSRIEMKRGRSRAGS